MCGLVGLAGDTNGLWKDVFSELLLIDTMRGPHSTGVGFVGRKDEEFNMAKCMGNPFNLFGTEPFEKFMAHAHPQKVLMGHNRYATIGDKTLANAHPFQFEHIMGAHNGTIDKWNLFDLHKSKEYGTDSESLLSSINEWGVKEAIGKAGGAWALTWFDKRDHTINMLRNDKRPLFYAYSEDGCTLVWASESDMIRYVMKRRGKKIMENTLYNPTPDMMFSWKVPDSVNGKIGNPKQVKVEGKKWFTGYQHPFQEGRGSICSTSTTTSPHTSNILAFPKRVKTKKFRPPYKDMYGRVINKPEFTRMVKEGCAFCTANGQKWGEFVHILGPYLGDHTAYACEPCYNETDNNDLVQYAI